MRKVVGMGGYAEVVHVVDLRVNYESFSFPDYWVSWGSPHLSRSVTQSPSATSKGENVGLLCIIRWRTAFAREAGINLQRLQM